MSRDTLCQRLLLGWRAEKKAARRGRTRGGVGCEPVAMCGTVQRISVTASPQVKCALRARRDPQALSRAQQCEAGAVQRKRVCRSLLYGAACAGSRCPWLRSRDYWLRVRRLPIKARRMPVTRFDVNQQSVRPRQPVATVTQSVSFGRSHGLRVSILAALGTVRSADAGAIQHDAELCAFALMLLLPIIVVPAMPRSYPCQKRHDAVCRTRCPAVLH